MDYNYSQEELKLRKYWKLSGICQIIFTPICIVLFSLSWRQAPHLALGVGFAVWVMLVQNISFWVLYQCAYRRPGTRCLGVFLWWAGSVYVGLSIKAVFVLLILIVNSTFSGWIIVGIALCVLKFYWYSFCLKLYALNKKMKAIKSFPEEKKGSQDQGYKDPTEKVGPETIPENPPL